MKNPDRQPAATIDINPAARGQELTIFVTGDFCPLYNLEKRLATGRIEGLFGSLQPVIHEVDISVLNLEAPLTRRRTRITKCGPNLKANPSIASALRQSGFSHANLANNHIRDFDSAGVVDTTRALKEAGVRWFGVGENYLDAMKPLRIWKRELRIAMLAFAENEFGQADNGGWGAAPMMPAQNCHAIAKAAQAADITLVFVHGGNEMCPFPSPRMIKLYRSYAQAGATAVIGSHTHVPQGYEVYHGVPIFYSLGNFLFPWTPTYDNHLWYSGLGIVIRCKGSRIGSIDVLPITADKVEHTCDLMKGPACRRFMRYVDRLSTLISDERKISRLWSAWCVMHGERWLKRLTSVTWPARTRRQIEQVVKLENMIHCEAHSELGQTFTKLVRTRTVTQARKDIPLLKQLMKG